MAIEEVIGEVLKRPVDTACTLIESLLGEPFQVAGSALADQVVYWQWKNRVTIFEKFQRVRSQRKLAIRVLPPDFLLPLIRECGDTSDETLQNAWARLLTAAVEDDANQHIGFIHVLKELSPIDARVLQAIVAIHAGISDDGKLYRDERYASLSKHLGLPTASIQLSMSNLFRLGLFNVTGNKLSGFARSFLQVCLADPNVLDEYLEKEETILTAVLMG